MFTSPTQGRNPVSKPKPTADQQQRTSRVISQLMLEHNPPVDDTGAANLMGMDRGQWRRTRNGHHTPSLQMIQRIAAAFQVDARDLSARLASDNPHEPGTLERIETALANANAKLDALLKQQHATPADAKAAARHKPQPPPVPKKPKRATNQQ